MALKMQTDFGEIDITNESIATVVGMATTQNYGVVGMASKHQIRDGIQEILKQENYTKGVLVSVDNNDLVVVDVYIIVNYGTKISEICRNVQSSAKYELGRQLGIAANVVNVYVQGVRVIED